MAILDLDQAKNRPKSKSLFGGLEKPLNRYIDHTLLRPAATEEDFQKLMEEAKRYNFASVCVPPYIALGAKQALGAYPDIKICTVVGFPHGNIPAILKAQEAHYFVSQKVVDEIDFVVNYGLLKAGMLDAVRTEIKAIDRICKQSGLVSKCIVETCYLTADEKAFMFETLYDHTTVDYIKTSTGYGSAGAQLIDVMNWNARRHQKIENKGTEVRSSALLVLHEEPAEDRVLKIKAAGGIKDLGTAVKFIQCGADRLGTSASVKIMEEYNAALGVSPEGGETS